MVGSEQSLEYFSRHMGAQPCLLELHEDWNSPLQLVSVGAGWLTNFGMHERIH